MQEWRIESPQTLDLTGVRRLKVRVVEGSLDVVGRTEDEAEGAASVEVTEIKGPLIVRLEDDGTLSVRHERLTWSGLLGWTSKRQASATIAVSISATCPVELGVVSADAVVSGITAPRTAVKSVSGDVTLDDVRSDISAETVSGDLESRQLAGSLSFKSVSGDLTVVDGASSSVRADSVSGDVVLDVALGGRAQVNISTVSGNVTLRMPDPVDAEVEVKSMSGSLSCEFDGAQPDRSPGKSTMRGRLGSGAGRLGVKTVSGDVTLLRRAGAA